MRKRRREARIRRSKLAGDHEFGGLGQYPVAWFERYERRERLRLKFLELLARPLDPEQGDEGSFPSLLVLARRLTDKGGIALNIQEVVGKLESGWTEQDRSAFDQRVAALGAQYDSYEGLPGLHVNGKLTMGENIGDLSGLAISLQAYHYSLNGKPAPVIDGYTGDQRYFLGFAQIWRSKSSEASIRRQVLSNPHSPSHWRVVGPTRNIDAWYDAFSVKPGDKYYLPPNARVSLW